jgi:hypothetical protein
MEQSTQGQDGSRCQSPQRNGRQGERRQRTLEYRAAGYQEVWKEIVRFLDALLSRGEVMQASGFGDLEAASGQALQKPPLRCTIGDGDRNATRGMILMIEASDKESSGVRLSC